MSNIISLNDVLATEILCYIPGQIGITVRHWRCISALGTPTVTFARVALGLNNIVAAPYKALLSNLATYYGTRCRRVFPVSPDRWEIDNASSGVGTAGAVAMPTQTCGLISLIGSVSGHKGQGRVFVPFPSQSDNQTVGEPVAGYVTRLDTLATQITTDLTVVSSPAGGTIVLRAQLGKTLEVVNNDITAFVSRSAWASQRSRGSFGTLNKLPF
jgi:hypothetical protein